MEVQASTPDLNPETFTSISAFVQAQTLQPFYHP